MNQLRDALLNVAHGERGSVESKLDAILDVLLQALPEDTTIFGKLTEFQEGRDSYYAQVRNTITEAKESK